MKLKLFNNQKGVIYGTDSKRIESEYDGVLKIGDVEVHLNAGAEAIMPLLGNGSTGRYSASFTNIIGREFELAGVSVRNGRITPPTQTALEFIELRAKADALEDRCDKLEEEVIKLQNIFDTNSLNFLINNNNNEGE